MICQDKLAPAHRLPQTEKASQCPFQCWKFSRKAVNTNFYDLFNDLISKRSKSAVPEETLYPFNHWSIMLYFKSGNIQWCYSNFSGTGSQNLATGLFEPKCKIYNVIANNFLQPKFRNQFVRTSWRAPLATLTQIHTANFLKMDDLLVLKMLQTCCCFFRCVYNECEATKIWHHRQLLKGCNWSQTSQAVA